MGLVLPQEVEAKWATTSRQHYMELGYHYTKIGDIFICNVKHLSKGSSIRVAVKCDFCEHISFLEYKAYLLLKSDKYCCPCCLKHKKKTRNSNGDLIFVEIPYRNRDWLYNEYIVKDREASDIAIECGINMRTLREWISMLELTIKQNKKSSLSKELLNDLFVVQRKTTLEIGKILGMSDGTILSALKDYKIKIPNRSEFMRRYYYEKGGIEKSIKYFNSMPARIKISCRMQGISESEFTGFKSDERKIIRNSHQYKEWRLSVFKRDNFTCQHCHKKGGDLQAHHIANFATDIDNRFDISNGITLCVECHSPAYQNSFHRIYGCINNNLDQLQEYIKEDTRTLPISS